jgi:hypothetical protein
MSFLTSIRAGSRRAMQSSYGISSTPAFHTSAARNTLKESDKSQSFPVPNTSETLTEAKIQTATTCRISTRQRKPNS